MSAVATVPIGVANGTNSAPQYTFTSDSNTGLYHYSTDNLGVTTGGDACAVFNSDGLSLRNGKKISLYDTGSSHSVSHKAPALTANVEFTWPNDAGSNGQVLATNGSGALSWQASVNDPPVGSIVMWPSATVPSGWLHCNGQSVERDTYEDLFNVISDDYGADDGDHFNVPDMRGLFVRGWANGESDDPGRASRTDRGDGTTGDNIGTLQSDNEKEHDHYMFTSQNPGSGTGGSDTRTEWAAKSPSVDATDYHAREAGTPFSNANWEYHISVLPDEPDVIKSGKSGSESRPKNIAMMYIIRAT